MKNETEITRMLQEGYSYSQIEAKLRCAPSRIAVIAARLFPDRRPTNWREKNQRLSKARAAAIELKRKFEQHKEEELRQLESEAERLMVMLKE